MTNPSLPTSDRVFDAMSSGAPRRRGRNFTAASLVEVLVVLVVLLIGIFAVIRIFPVGFGQLHTHRGAKMSRVDHQNVAAVSPPPGLAAAHAPAKAAQIPPVWRAPLRRDPSEGSQGRSLRTSHSK